MKQRVSMRVIDPGRGGVGGELNCIWQGKKGWRTEERGMAGVFISPSFSWNNAAFCHESDSEKGVGRFETQLKIPSHFNLITTSIPG